MVANLSLQHVALDAFYALGLGLLLGVIYTLLRMVAPKGAISAFLCDFGILVLAGVTYQSAATARFFGGVARWYTLLALILGYLAWGIAAHSKLEWVARVFKYAFLWPWIKLYKWMLRPILAAIIRLFCIFTQKKRLAKEKRRVCRAKQLQKQGIVLYNSK